MNITQEGEDMFKTHKVVKCNAKKPTLSDVMIHQAINFGKSNGIEIPHMITYVRRKKL